MNSVRKHILKYPNARTEPVAWQPRYKQEVIDHLRTVSDDVSEYAMTVFPTKEQAEEYGHGGHDVRPLYADPVKTAPAVAVKALEWNAKDSWNVSKTVIGTYVVRPCLATKFAGQWLLRRAQHEDSDKTLYASEDEAKAAAQADYDARILSTLSAQVQDVAGERWIDVNDKLPGEQGQDSEEVSVFLNGHCGLLDHDKRKGGGWGYRTGFYDADIGCFRVHGRPDRFVTHWMPLPAAPASKHGDAE